MKITDDYSNLAKFGIKVPEVEGSSIRAQTENKPIWVHFGGGNLFRCMQAWQQQKLIDLGLSNKGIILAETWDDGLIEQIYNKYDNRTLNIILKGDGSFDLELVDSIAKAVYVNANEEKGQAGFEYLGQVFQNESLQLATFTVTEKGYNIKDLKGQYFPPVALEIELGPNRPQSLMGVITAMLNKRFEANMAPIALLSTDNFSHNGDKLKDSVLQIAKEWMNNGFVTSKFVDYLNDSSKVSFPFSMIDRITPAPSEVIAQKLKDLGIEDCEIVKTVKFSVSSSFVNAEETKYLIVEDNFPNGRPALEEAGVIFTTKQKVDEVERMKVCTCLNPLHTALAITGCLLGFNKISDEVKDPDLLALINKIGYLEGMPVVTDPGIVNPEEFIKEVIENRLPNPYIPDTPQRIATDTSQKLPIRFGVTIKMYNDSQDLDVNDLNAIPFVLACWLRYLIGIDDFGEKFERSPDPMFSELDDIFSNLNIGDSEDKFESVRPLLSDSNIFGVDLKSVKLDDKVFNYFKRLMDHPGSVREVLKELIK